MHFLRQTQKLIIIQKVIFSCLKVFIFLRNNWGKFKTRVKKGGKGSNGNDKRERGRSHTICEKCRDLFYDVIKINSLASRRKSPVHISILILIREEKNLFCFNGSKLYHYYKGFYCVFFLMTNHIRVKRKKSVCSKKETEYFLKIYHFNCNDYNR